MSFELETAIKKDHPSLAGHFPGNPVVPGVVLLDQVRIAIEAWQPGHHVAVLTQVKFLKPLLPEQGIKILLEENDGKVRFLCQRGDDLIAQGQMSLQNRQ